MSLGESIPDVDGWHLAPHEGYMITDRPQYLVHLISYDHFDDLWADVRL